MATLCAHYHKQLLWLLLLSITLAFFTLHSPHRVIGNELLLNPDFSRQTEAWQLSRGAKTGDQPAIPRVEAGTLKLNIDQPGPAGLALLSPAENG